MRKEEEEKREWEKERKEEEGRRRRKGTVAEHGHAAVDKEPRLGPSNATIEGDAIRADPNHCHHCPIQWDNPCISVHEGAHAIVRQVDIVVEEVEDGADKGDGHEVEDLGALHLNIGHLHDDLVTPTGPSLDSQVSYKMNVNKKGISIRKNEGMRRRRGRREKSQGNEETEVRRVDLSERKYI